MKLKDMIDSMVTKFAALALALVCAGNVWATTVATEAELRAAIASGGAVTLGGNIALTEEIAVGTTVTLDLGTYTISSPTNVFRVAANGNFTVNADATSPGGISTATNRCCVYTSYGWDPGAKTVVLNGGVFTGNCVFNWSETASQNIEVLYGFLPDGYGSGEKTVPTSVTINGGTFTGGYEEGNVGAYRCYYFTVNGGTFERGLDCADTPTCSIGVTTTCKAFFNGGRYRDRYPTFRRKQYADDPGKVFIGTEYHTNVYYYADGYYVNAYDYSACQCTGRWRGAMVEDANILLYMVTQCWQNWMSNPTRKVWYFLTVADAQSVNAGSITPVNGTENVVSPLTSAAGESVRSATATVFAASPLKSAKRLLGATSQEVPLAKGNSESDITSPDSVSADWRDKITVSSIAEYSSSFASLNNDVAYTTPLLDDLDDRYDQGLVEDYDAEEEKIMRFVNREDMDACYVFALKGSVEFENGTDWKIVVKLSRAAADKSMEFYLGSGNAQISQEVDKRVLSLDSSSLEYVLPNSPNTTIGDYTKNPSLLGNFKNYDKSNISMAFPFLVAIKNTDSANEGIRVEVQFRIGDTVCAAYTHDIGEYVPEGKKPVEGSFSEYHGNNEHWGEYDISLKDDSGNYMGLVYSDTRAELSAVFNTIENVSETGLESVEIDADDGVSLEKWVQIEWHGLVGVRNGAPMTTFAFGVEPMLAATISNETTTRAITNAELNNQTIKFRLPLTDDYTARALVVHTSDDANYPEERWIANVGDSAGARYVEISTTHFSEFTVSPLGADDIVYVTSAAGAFIGGYTTLADAYAATEDGGTIYLLQNVSDDISVSTAKTFNINKGEFTYSGTVTAADGISLASSTSGATTTYTATALPVVATVTANDVTTNFWDLHAALEACKASGTTITLLTDVDLSGVNWVPVGTSASPFTGVFDGNGKTISNLSVNDEALTYAGLLGYVTGSTFKNITISNVTVNAAASIGSLMGYCNTSSVTNCHVQGRIQLSGHYKMGGILGEGYTNFTDCSVIGDGESTSSILATPLMKTDDPTKYEYEADNIGGMVGHWSEGTATIKNCTVKDISVTGYRKIGGMVAISFCSQKIEDVTVENVKVTCTAPKAYAEDNTSTTGMGGIVGQYHRQGGEYTGGWMKGATVKNVTLEATDTEALGIIKAGLVSSGLRDSADAESPISKASMTFSDIVFEGENSIPDGVKTMNDAAFGPVYVAQIGTTKYETLADAIEDLSDGDTLKVLADVVYADYEWLEVNCTVDLGGHTLTFDDEGIIVIDETYEVVFANGSIVSTLVSDDASAPISCAGYEDEEGEYTHPRLILDNVAIQSVVTPIDVRDGGVLVVSNSTITVTGVGTNTGIELGAGGMATLGAGMVLSAAKTGVNVDGGTLVVDGGAISGDVVGINIEADSSVSVLAGSVTGGEDGIEIWGNGNAAEAPVLTISGGTVVGTAHYGVTGNGTKDNDNDYSETVVTIDGGVISGGIAGIYNPQKGSLAISGCTVEGANAAVWAKSGSTAISGGAFKATSGSALLVEAVDYPGGNPEVAVSGGVFSSAVPDEYCAVDYSPAANTDAETKDAYPYTVAALYEAHIVRNGEVVAGSGGALAAVVAAAEDGDTVMLLKDVELALENEITISDESIVLDLSGHTITATESPTVFYVRNTGSLTIYGNKADANNPGGIVKTYSSGYIIKNYSGHLDVHGGFYTISGDSAIKCFYLAGDYNTISDATIRSESENTSAYAVEVIADSTAVLTNCKLYSKGGYAVTRGNSASPNNPKSLTVTGCEFSGKGGANTLYFDCALFENCTFNVEGTGVYGKANKTFVKDCQIVSGATNYAVRGATIEGTENVITATTDGCGAMYAVTVAEDAFVKVSAAKISKSNSPFNGMGLLSTNDLTNVTLSQDRKIVERDPSEEDYATYPYAVVYRATVAQIGTIKYETFADAIDAAEAYKTANDTYPVITVLDATAEQTNDGWMFTQDGQRLVRKVAMVTTNVDNYATTNYYASAAEAFSAAESTVANKSGTGTSYAYVTLLADDTLPGDATTVLKSNHGRTDRRYIDLNGHTLTAPKGISLEYKSGGFQVYLQDGSAGQTGRVVNPTADAPEAFVFTVGSSVSLTVEGGAIVANGEGTALKTTGGGSITLKGGSVTADPAGRALNAAGTNSITAEADSSVSVTGTLGVPTGVLTLRGGTFTANAANGELFDVGETGSVAVSGGSYSSAVPAQCIATGYKDAGQTAVVSGYYTVTKEVYTITFLDENDNVIISGQLEYNALYSTLPVPAIPVKVSDDPAFYYKGAWVPSASTSTRATGNATHKLTYTQGKYGFQYGDGLYTNSLANAYKAVADGGTVTVLTNAFALTSTTLNLAKDVTVDLNGSTLSMNNTGMLTVSGEGTKVTFVNGTVKYGSGTQARDALVKVTSPAEVAFEGVTLQGASYYTTAVSVASGASAAFSGECAVTMPSGKQAVTAADGGTVAISGGIYSSEVPVAYCAMGYVPANNTDSSTADDYPWTVAHKDGVYVVKNDDGEGYAEIKAVKVEPTWIDANVPKAGTTATTAEIEDALNAPDTATGLKKWEAYVLNQEEPIKIKSIESVGNDDKLTTTLVDAKTDTGLDVSYSLVKVDSATGAETDGTASASKTFTLEKANGSLETGLYKVRVHFKPTGDEKASEITVDSVNTVGVLKTQPTGQFVVVPVPFKELGGNDAPVKVASYIRSGLANGDVLHVYNGSNYDSWTYNSTSWDKTTNVTKTDENTVSTSESAEPSVAALSRGTAAILRRAEGNTGPLVFVGDYTGAAEQQITAGWNLVASPSLEPFDPSTKFTSGKIQIPGDGLPKNYTFKNGKWGYSGVVEVDAPNGNGKIKMPGRIEVDTLPAGTGFWYFSDSQQTIEW